MSEPTKRTSPLSAPELRALKFESVTIDTTGKMFPLSVPRLSYEYGKAINAALSQAADSQERIEQALASLERGSGLIIAETKQILRGEARHDQ